MSYLVLVCLGCVTLFKEVPNEVYTVKEVKECFPNFTKDGGFCTITVEEVGSIEILHEGYVKKGDKVKKFCTESKSACYYKYIL